jgi:IS5 family transposase
LQKLKAVIEWELFRKPIEKALSVQAKALGGRPPFDQLMMFKILILQRHYNLLDAQCECQIKDRLSLMDFLGIDPHDKVPDENTIGHFMGSKPSYGCGIGLMDTQVKVTKFDKHQISSKTIT